MSVCTIPTILYTECDVTTTFKGKSPSTSYHDGNIDSNNDGVDDDDSRIDCTVEHACLVSVDPEEGKQKTSRQVDVGVID